MKKNCEMIETFMQTPHTYDIHILATYGNAIIHNQIYRNISPSNGDVIGNLRSTNADIHGISTIQVRITDNTMYEEDPTKQPLKLLIDTERNRYPIQFVGSIDMSTTGGRDQRSVDFRIERYGGMTVLFNM